MRGLLLLALASVAAADDDWLAVHFSLAADTVTHNATTYVCIKLTLRPEDGGQKKDQWEVVARVQHRAVLPAGFDEAAAAACDAAGGTYKELDRLRRFVAEATSTGDGESADDSGAAAAAATSTAAAAASESPLARAIKTWNDRFFNMDTAVTRQNADRFHGRGVEHKHLAQEVTHVVMPREVQGRIEARLATHRAALFGDEGAGQGGTTGAHFLAGNVGFGNANQGANLMDLVFPPPTDAPSKVDASLFDGDGYGRRRGGSVLGEATDSTGASRPPDLVAYEAEVKRLLLLRSDVAYLFGGEIEMQWQHRLWRYGPHFDPKAKGGVWHKDTCPFGINGALPEDAIMFTIVYILHAENLDWPTAGTRVKDDDGTSVSLPCVAGEANVIRSGESDADAFLHSGPLNMRKLDATKPAYRVMLQSKVVVRPRDGRRRAIPSRGNWRGLGVGPLGESAEDWLAATSKRLTAGVGESNAVGFEAYPINVGRAWAVTNDLCTFLGFQTGGLLPEPEDPDTPVALFGWDQRYSEGVVDALRDASFRVLNVASESDFAELRKNRQEVYSNLEHADIDDPSRVARALGGFPYDVHVVVDVPPVGPRALGDRFLARYGAAFAALAAKGRGEGRLATLTLLSTQMPAAGRDSAGVDAGGPLTETQKAFLALEKDVVAFGAAHDVRVVVMRVADRVYAPENSAVKRIATSCETENPCRVENCTDAEPLTRIHSEDLALVLKRMLAMFDIVETHGADSAMRGTASFDTSIARFPSGTVLEVVDDGLPDSMRKADLWAAAMMGSLDVADLACAENSTEDRVPSRPHRAARGRNADLKLALGMPHLRYASYHSGGAKMFGAGEF